VVRRRGRTSFVQNYLRDSELFVFLLIILVYRQNNEKVKKIISNIFPIPTNYWKLDTSSESSHSPLSENARAVAWNLILEVRGAIEDHWDTAGECGVVWLVGVEEKQEPPPIEETDFFPPREMQRSLQLCPEQKPPDPTLQKTKTMNGPGPSTELRERTRVQPCLAS
jgi:hypothetical protein